MDLAPSKTASLSQAGKRDKNSGLECVGFILNLGSAGGSEFVGLDCKQHQVSQLALWPLWSWSLCIASMQHLYLKGEHVVHATGWTRILLVECSQFHYPPLPKLKFRKWIKSKQHNCFVFLNTAFSGLILISSASYHLKWKLFWDC